MDQYTLYKAYEKGHYIHESCLCKVVNYICGNLVSWSPNRFWLDEYNAVSNLYIVCMWERDRGLPLLAKKGDTICNDQLVNFLKDEKYKDYFCSKYTERYI